MKIIINTSTLSGTGVTQVSVSFLYECIEISDNEYHVFLSKTVLNQIKITDFPKNFKFYIFKKHPLNLFYGFTIRNRLRTLSNKINPNCVFSIFGPSWWTPKYPHLIGYAYPHYVYPESPFFNIIPLYDRLLIFLKKIIHVFFLKRNGKYFVCETKDVTKRLHKLLKVNINNIFTVSNTYNNYFTKINHFNTIKIPTINTNDFILLSLCSFEKHKNLIILNEVIPLLNKIDINNNIKFILTIDKNLYEKNFHPIAKKSIINLGRIDVKECPELYEISDVVFLPTLLECFTANYPEAMVMNKPILTSNLTFAKEICQEAAYYFDPINPVDIVNKILDIKNNHNLRINLISLGKSRLKNFNSAQERAMEYLTILNNISK